MLIACRHTPTTVVCVVSFLFRMFCLEAKQFFMCSFWVRKMFVSYVLPRITCLHAEWTDRHIFVIARLDVTCVILMPVVLQAELLFASVAPERQFGVTKLTLPLLSILTVLSCPRAASSEVWWVFAHGCTYVKGRKSFFSLQPRYAHACIKSGNSIGQGLYQKKKNRCCTQFHKNVY